MEQDAATSRPLARSHGLVVTELEGEAIVYDRATDQMHLLNRTVTFLWMNCDGKTTVRELVDLLSSSVGATIQEEVVWMALQQCSEQGLLVEGVTPTRGTDRVTRRQVLQRAGVLAGGALLLPVITSMAAPTPAMAASVMPGGTTTGGGTGGTCVPNCNGKSCGDDGCGGTCACGSGNTCWHGHCFPCGGLGQLCCPGNTCPSSLFNICIEGFLCL